MAKYDFTVGSGTSGSHSHTFNGLYTTTTSNPYWGDTSWYHQPYKSPRLINDQFAVVDGKKEKSVKSEISDVVSKRRAKKIEQIVDEVEAVLNQIPHDDGFIVAWNAKFKTGDKVYRYAAIQTGGVWWVTNRTGSITRDELLELLVEQRMEATVEGLRWLSA